MLQSPRAASMIKLSAKSLLTVLHEERAELGAADRELVARRWRKAESLIKRCRSAVESLGVSLEEEQGG